MHKDSVYVREMLKAGAKGYLLKDSVEHDLLEAVRTLARGGEYISPAVQSALNSPYRIAATTPLDLLTSHQTKSRSSATDRRGEDEQGNRGAAEHQRVYRGCAPWAHHGKAQRYTMYNELVRFAVRNGLVD